MSTFTQTQSDNTSRRRRRLPLIAVIGTLLLVAALAVGWPMVRRLTASHNAARFADYGAVPDVQLIERDGGAMHLGSLKGKVWVADFIFTRCAGSCPAMSAKMSALEDSLAGLADVMLVSFTVDPDHDTPQRLAAYADGYHAAQQRWLFLTGGRDQMQNLAKNDFHLAVQEGTDPKEPIIHSKRFVLVDRAGHIRGYYSSDEPQSQRKLLDDVAALVEEDAQ